MLQRTRRPTGLLKRTSYRSVDSLREDLIRCFLRMCRMYGFRTSRRKEGTYGLKIGQIRVGTVRFSLSIYGSVTVLFMTQESQHSNMFRTSWTSTPRAFYRKRLHHIREACVETVMSE